jgi:hypothetical protein
MFDFYYGLAGYSDEMESYLQLPVLAETESLV